MLKVGVIGLGTMGKNHVRVYSELPDVQLVGVADIDYKLAQRLAKQYNTEPFSDYKELIKEELNAVSIAVPNSIHREVAVEVARAGVNMLLEKPIAHTIEAAKEIIKATEENKVKLMIGHIERFNPIIPAIKKEIENDSISMIEITRIGPFPPRVKDVGVVIDLATHDIDLISYLTGSQFKKIYSLTSRNIAQYEDAAILLFEMANGVLARVTLNWLTPFKVREINIATKENFIKASFIDQKLLVYSKYIENDSYLVREQNMFFQEPLKLELQAFVSCVKEDSPPPVSGEDGLKALETAIRCLDKAV